MLADCEAVPTYNDGREAYLLEANVKIEFWNEGWEEQNGEEAPFCKVCGCILSCAHARFQLCNGVCVRARTRARTHTQNMYTHMQIYIYTHTQTCTR